MNPRNRFPRGPLADALAARLARFDALVEVGIGTRTGVAARLADDARVTATDLRACAVPDGITFVRDDVTDPEMAIYVDADALYALNLPCELHRPTRTVARAIGAELLFTTLGGESPAIATDLETLPAGETLFRATSRGWEDERA